VMTDPPYTVRGGALFVARAVSALRPGVGGEVLLCFGPRDHAESLELYRRVAELGLYPRAVIRNFSEYVGAGVLGGVSHLHHLVLGSEARPASSASEPGPIYTADARPPARDYECTRCGAVRRVGRGARWRTVADLKAAGCGDGCTSTSFRPRARA
jgi:N4-bis(aminopropyl)spermidine synthase